MISKAHPSDRWEDDSSELEIPLLLGGDVTEGVVRVGATVRRPTGHNAAFIHALLRRLEAASFVTPDGIYLDLPSDPPRLPPAPSHENELIGHLDITSENVVLRSEQAHALIDFDLVRPATRVDELCNAMLHWAPLNEPEDVDPGLRGLDAPNTRRTARRHAPQR
jgi:hypothetical protein